MIDSESDRGTKKPRPAWFDWLQIFAVAAVLVFVLNTLLITNARVPTGSMITTIMPGDHVVGSHLPYRFEDPAHGDIITFHTPDEPKTFYIKRIIGLPDNKATIRDGNIYLNDSETPLEESYIKEPTKPTTSREFQVSEGVYLCMGDNRSGSVDACYWEDHYIYRDKTAAKVLFRCWPSIKVLK